MITIDIDGVKYGFFESVSITKNLETLSGSFTFQSSVTDTSVFPVRRSAAVSIFVDSNKVMDGYVDSIDVAYTSDSHTLTISGRDKTCDVIDSTIIGDKEFKAPIALERMIRQVLDAGNMQFIKVINQAGSIKEFSAGEICAAEIGQSMFEFFEKYARKRQVLLTSDADGNIIITRAGATQAYGLLNCVIGSQFNNILSASISYNDIDRFNVYRVHSQLNISGKIDEEDEDEDEDKTVDQQADARDNNIRTSRQIEITSGSSDGVTDIKNLATWNSNLRRARSEVYKCSVQGHYQDVEKKRLWKINELVNVNDTFCNIASTLLVRSVTYSVDIGSGSTTDLELVTKDAYTLEAELEAVQERANQLGKNLKAEKKREKEEEDEDF